MNILQQKLKPIEINIESVEKISDLKSRTNFKVTFQIGFFFNLRRLRFESKGTFETGETIDKGVLIKILESTDHDKFIDSNMKKRNVGNFDYQYLHNGNWLTINYSTF